MHERNTHALLTNVLIGAVGVGATLGAQVGGGWAMIAWGRERMQRGRKQHRRHEGKRAQGPKLLHVPNQPITLAYSRTHATQPTQPMPQTPRRVHARTQQRDRVVREQAAGRGLADAGEKHAGLAGGGVVAACRGARAVDAHAAARGGPRGARRGTGAAVAGALGRAPGALLAHREVGDAALGGGVDAHGAAQHVAGDGALALVGGGVAGQAGRAGDAYRAVADAAALLRRVDAGCAARDGAWAGVRQGGREGGARQGGTGWTGMGLAVGRQYGTCSHGARSVEKCSALAPGKQDKTSGGGGLGEGGVGGGLGEGGVGGGLRHD